MKAYPHYKDAGLPWISSIPEHWGITRAKYLYKKENRPVLPNDEVVTCFRDGTVTLRKNRRTTGFTESLQESGYQGIRKGDLVIHIMDAFAGASGVSDSDGKGTPVYNVCTALSDSNNFYYAHILRIMAKSGFIQSLYRGIRERSSDFRFEVFARQYLPVPPRFEQDQIVHYLDWQVSKINKLIEAKKKQIKLVEEERDSLINSAVTHGIDNAPLIESDTYNWMGTIPQNWRMIPSKRLFLESKEVRHPDDMPATASQKYGIILQSEFMRREGRRIVIAFQGLDDWKHVEPDNFVISLRSFQGGIERATITACVTWHYIVLLPQKDVCPSYFKWLLKSKSYIRALQSTSDFIRDGQDLRYSHFTKLDLPLIPLDEQNRIAQFIENSCRKYDEIIPKLERQIELLHELRTRLISDVVTGQVDVRGIEVPTFEYVDDNGDTDVEADITADDPTEEV